MGFVPRMSIPDKGNPYYNTKKSGGYSSAVKGKPTEEGLDVLRNCVGYANGRFAEIQGLNKIKYQLVCNAEKFLDKAKALGLTTGSVPKLGAIMVWQGGTTKLAEDGAGHVAVVEEIKADGSVITSESGWNAKRAFWTQTRTNKNGRWGQNSKYSFLGFIYNPGVNAEDVFGYYMVQRGDNLTKIAKKFGTSVSVIVRINKIMNPNLIKPGTTLKIPRG